MCADDYTIVYDTQLPQHMSAPNDDLLPDRQIAHMRRCCYISTVQKTVVQ